MQRYIEEQLRADLGKKLVLLTGPRQVGKTTVSRMLQAEWPSAVYLNFDTAPDRATNLSQSWSQRAPLLVLDEIHKMPSWKSWLKGMFDSRALVGGVPQQILVTGSARMDTFRQTGESLAGRYFALRLHPISLREWSQQTHASPEDALTHLLARGGFTEPCLAGSAVDADRWRRDYFADLIREDVLEFSRLKDINAMRLFAQTLQKRVGSPLSLAAIARDIGVSPKTLASYLEILQALFIVFTVRPWSRNITRTTLLQPKVYFFDTGLVQGDAGVRFENLVACHLLKHAQWQQDAMGKSVELHYLRTKDGAEVDFALSDLTQSEPHLTDLIACKLADTKPHPALKRFAAEQPQAQAVQLLRDIRHEQDLGAIQLRGAANWLMALSA